MFIDWIPVVISTFVFFLASWVGFQRDTPPFLRVLLGLTGINLILTTIPFVLSCLEYWS